VDPPQKPQPVLPPLPLVKKKPSFWRGLWKGVRRLSPRSLGRGLWSGIRHLFGFKSSKP
jgi:hypothetical protein